MRKFDLSRLLQLVVLVPLLAMGAFGGVLVLETLDAYRNVEHLSALEQLVAAASRLTMRPLNAESTATQAFVDSGSDLERAEMMAARKVSDEAVRSFKEAAASADLTDPKAIGIIGDIVRQLGGLDSFRQRADARTLDRRAPGELLALRSALASVQRIAALIDQDQLNEALLGSAIMQMNHGQVRIQPGKRSPWWGHSPGTNRRPVASPTTSDLQQAVR